MILADTSIWISYLREGSVELDHGLEQGSVLTHSMIRGELALGSIASRREFLDALSWLPHALRATDDEVIALIERHGLHGSGLGLVDVHLLASALLTPGVRIWTKDQRLRSAAAGFGVGFEPT